MSEILFHYHKVDPTTWVYVSSLMMIALYFKFNRFWSVRNLDLALLILLAPGLLMVNQAQQLSQAAETNAAATPGPAVGTVEAATATDSALTSTVEQASTEETTQPPATATTGGNNRNLAYLGYLW